MRTSSAAVASTHGQHCPAVTEPALSQTRYGKAVGPRQMAAPLPGHRPSSRAAPTSPWQRARPAADDDNTLTPIRQSSRPAPSCTSPAVAGPTESPREPHLEVGMVQLPQGPMPDIASHRPGAASSPVKTQQLYLSPPASQRSHAAKPQIWRHSSTG